MSKKITRRQFLAYTAAGIGATALTCGGLGTLAFRPPKINFVDKFAAGKDPSNPSVLVAYASKAGSTMEISQAIAGELEKRNFTVDIGPIKQMTVLKDYDYVVIGSAIRMSAPMPEVIEFIQQNQSLLHTIPTAFFAVHLANLADDEVSSKARLAYLDSIRPLLSLSHEAFFAGVFDPSKLSFIEGLMGKMMQSPAGDFRDWDAIMGWGQSIFPA